MDENAKTVVITNVEGLIQNKNILIKSLEILQQSCYSKENVFDEINIFFKNRNPELNMVYDLLTVDNKILEGWFNEAKISTDKIKELFDLKKKFENLVPVVTYYRYIEDTGILNRWTSYTKRAYADVTFNSLLIDVKLNSFNKEIFRVIDDSSSIYRLGGLFQYIVREELENMSSHKLFLPKERLDELEFEINRSTEENEKIKELLKKIRSEIK